VRRRLVDRLNQTATRDHVKSSFADLAQFCCSALK
jgi:hypothetical protein